MRSDDWWFVERSVLAVLWMRMMGSRLVWRTLIKSELGFWAMEIVLMGRQQN